MMQADLPVDAFQQALLRSDWRTITKLFCDNINLPVVCENFHKSFQEVAAKSSGSIFLNKSDPYSICVFLFTVNYDSEKETAGWYEVLSKYQAVDQALTKIKPPDEISFDEKITTSLLGSYHNFMYLYLVEFALFKKYDAIKYHQSRLLKIVQDSSAAYYINQHCYKDLSDSQRAYSSAVCEGIIQLSLQFKRELDSSDSEKYKSLLEKFKEGKLLEDYEPARTLTKLWLQSNVLTDSDYGLLQFYQEAKKFLVANELPSYTENIKQFLKNFYRIFNSDWSLNEIPIKSQNPAVQFAIAGAFNYCMLQNILVKIIIPDKMIYIVSGTNSVGVFQKHDGNIFLYRFSHFGEELVRDIPTLTKKIVEGLYNKYFLGKNKEVRFGFGHCYWPIGIAIYGFDDNSYAEVDKLELLQGCLNIPSLPEVYEGENKTTALHLAATVDCYQSAEFLLQHGANPNIKRSDNDFTPLHLAAYYGSVELLQLLLSYNADPAIRPKTKGGRCYILHLGSTNSNTDIFRALITHTNASVVIAELNGKIKHTPEIDNLIALHESSKKNSNDLKRLEKEKKLLLPDFELNVGLLKVGLLRGFGPGELSLLKCIRNDSIYKARNCAANFSFAIEQIISQNFLAAGASLDKAMQADKLFANELYQSVVNKLYFRFNTKFKETQKNAIVDTLSKEFAKKFDMHWCGNTRLVSQSPVISTTYFENIIAGVKDLSKFTNPPIKEKELDEKEIPFALTKLWLKGKMDKLDFDQYISAVMAKQLPAGNEKDVCTFLLNLKNLANSKQALNEISTGKILQFTLAGCFDVRLLQRVLLQILKPNKLIYIIANSSSVGVFQFGDNIFIYRASCFGEEQITESQFLSYAVIEGLYQRYFSNKNESTKQGLYLCSWPMGICIYGVDDNLYETVNKFELLKGCTNVATLKDVHEGENQVTALHLAAAINCYYSAYYLLTQCVADPNAVTKANATALHWAAYYGSVALIWLLFEYKVDPAIRMKENGFCRCTALHFSTIKPCTDNFRALLTYVRIPGYNNYLKYSEINGKEVKKNEEIKFLIEVLEDKDHKKYKAKEKFWEDLSKLQNISLGLVKVCLLRGIRQQELSQKLGNNIKSLEEIEVQQAILCAENFSTVVEEIQCYYPNKIADNQQQAIKQLMLMMVATDNDFVFTKELCLSVLSNIYFTYKDSAVSEERAKCRLYVRKQLEVLFKEIFDTSIT